MPPGTGGGFNFVTRPDFKEEREVITYRDFSAGDPVWVVQKYSDHREPDGVVNRITGSGQIVLEEGRRFTPRGEGYAKDRCTYLFLAGRHNELIEIIRQRVTDLGGLDKLSVLKLERIADVIR
jgi:hypothetical protein